MAVKTRYQDALKKIGVTCVEYRVEVEQAGMVEGETWTNCMAVGVALQRNGVDWRVIEHVPRGWGGDGKWRVYGARSTAVEAGRYEDDNEPWYRLSNPGIALGTSRTQREALATAIKSGL